MYYEVQAEEVGCDFTRRRISRRVADRIVERRRPVFNDVADYERETFPGGLGP